MPEYTTNNLEIYSDSDSEDSEEELSNKESSDEEFSDEENQKNTHITHPKRPVKYI